MSVIMVRQYSVFLPNTPGALSAFIKLFIDQGINIMGIASDIRDDSGVVRIAVDSDKRVGYILTQAGFTSIETPVLSVEMPDRPGSIFTLSKLLGDAGINITTVYGTSLGGNRSRILVATSNPQKALEVLIASAEMR